MNEQDELRRFDELWRAKGRLAVALPVLLVSLLAATVLAFIVPGLPANSTAGFALLVFGVPAILAGVVTSIGPIVKAIRLGA